MDEPLEYNLAPAGAMFGAVGSGHHGAGGSGDGDEPGNWGLVFFRLRALENNMQAIAKEFAEELRGFRQETKEHRDAEETRLTKLWEAIDGAKEEIASVKMRVTVATGIAVVVMEAVIRVASMIWSHHLSF